ncbi:MAG: hypothetical protein A4E55_01844 [Pelotomaculum sp. PtaU1.Bin035]|nr:MAG: hypothetical protein A4E55_01844 [Pelotomaculum sp. PtaU1.Bin035]
MIIAYLGRNVKDYRENILRYLEDLALTCPKCGSRTVFHATYERHVHIDEIVEWLTIQRVICIKCSGTHAVIPDFIRPYKHYSTGDSEMSLRDVDDGIPVERVETTASISTLRRWIAEFREKSRQAAGALRALLFRLYAGTVNESQLFGLKIFGVLEKILKKLPRIRSSSFVIGNTNIWLTNCMAGIFV